jgi:hypothetical protein
MSVRFAVLFVVFLAYVLSSGVVSKHGSGLDPMGLNAPPAPPAPTSDQGSGWDPWG